MKTLFLSLITTALIGWMSAAVAQSETTRELHKVYALEQDGRVVIDTYKGSITVSTWSKAEVELHVKIEADGGSRSDEENVALTEIQMDSSPRELRLETDYHRTRSSRSFLGFTDNDGNRPFVHYTVTMPATADLVIEDYKSESSIRGLSADLRFESYKGTLEASGIAGAINLETYKGDVDLAIVKLGGDCRLETYKGSIRIRLPKGAGFELDAELGRRADLSSDFDIDGLREGHDRDEREYRGPVNGGGPVIRMESYKGKLRLMTQ